MLFHSGLDYFMGKTTMVLKQFQQNKVQTVLNVYCVMDKFVSWDIVDFSYMNTTANIISEYFNISTFFVLCIFPYWSTISQLL